MGCAETENPALPDGPLLIEDLAAACLKYERDPHNYTQAVHNFREALGIDVKVDETARNIDLSRDEHCRHLINLFLNPWQCRLPNPESNEKNQQKRELILERYARTYPGLADWWRSFHEMLPAASERLVDASDDDLKRCVEPFEELCDVQVADEQLYKRKSYGEVAASKTLYILRPHYFIAWDDDTQTAFGFPSGGSCGRFYVRFLKRARGRMQELRELCEKSSGLEALPELAAEEARALGGHIESRWIENIAASTVAELLNRYYWIRVPRKPSKSTRHRSL